MTLRELYERHPDLFYRQSWWMDEAFADDPAPEPLPTLSPDVKPFSTVPFTLRATLPKAVTLASVFVDHFVRTGELLWAERRLWTSDVDHAGDRVYVGGYALERPHGFAVHRMLTPGPAWGIVTQA